MARVSILIPAYNVGFFLSETLESVLQQTVTDWEAIVLDDASSDNTFNIAQQYARADSRIQVHRNEHNLGMRNNWNKGITLCHAPFFVKLDADDVWHPQMLEKALVVLDANPQVGLVFSRYQYINENGEITAPAEALPGFARNAAFSCIPLVLQGPDKMLAYPILRQGLSVMRRTIFDEIGDYRLLLTPATQASTDTEFYFRLGAHHKIFCIDEVLYKYRTHQASISRVDERNNLDSRKIYEIKQSILQYYYSCKLITRKAFLAYRRIVNNEFAYKQIAANRNAGNYKMFVAALAKQFFKEPVSFLAFYKDRLLKR